MNGWLMPKAELAAAQQRAIEAGIDQHQVIYGATGAGKSQILLHRARYLCDRYHIPPHQFRIFVGTNMIKGYLRDALSLLNLPETSISTLDSWTLSYYRAHLGNQLPLTAARQPDFIAMRRAIMQRVPANTNNETFLDLLLQPVLNILRGDNTIRLPFYNFLLVDDGEWLDRDAFSLLRVLARHITIAADKDQPFNDQAIKEPLHQFGASRSLIGAFRSSPDIINLAAQLIEDQRARASYILAAKKSELERETPTLYLAKDQLDEQQRIVEVVRNRVASGEHVAVLLPNDQQVFELANRLKDARLEIKRLVNDPNGDGSANRLDFTNDFPKLLTYKSAPGLTFDSVILPDLTIETFKNLSDIECRRMLFTGITRATKWVFLSTIKGRELPILKPIIALEDLGLISIKSAVRQVQPTRIKVDPPAGNDSDLTDLL